MSAEDGEEERVALRPFYDLTTVNTVQVRVRGGYETQEGEVSSLFIDVTVSIERAPQAEELAREWYIDELAALEAEAEAEEVEP